MKIKRTRKPVNAHDLFPNLREAQVKQAAVKIPIKLKMIKPRFAWRIIKFKTRGGMFYFIDLHLMEVEGRKESLVIEKFPQAAQFRLTP